MKLPRVPYKLTKNMSEVIAMRGINYGDMLRDGDLRESTNLSARRYPYLSVRRGRYEIDDNDFPEAFAMTEWDGKLVVATYVEGMDAAELNYDGDVLKDSNGEIVKLSATREKQFAVVGNKLVVFPDKIAMSLEDKSFIKLETVMETSDSTMTDTSIQATVYEPLRRGKTFSFGGIWNGNQNVGGSGVGYSTPAIYSYGVDKDAMVWDEEEEKWNVPDGVLSCVYKNAKGNNTTLPILKRGDIIIPNASYAPVYVDYRHSNGQTPNDEEDGNKSGFFGVITNVVQDHEDLSGAYTILYYDIYSAKKKNALFSSELRVGDCVDISGTLYGYNDKDKAEILSIDEVSNTITFQENTFSLPALYARLSNDLADGEYYMQRGNVTSTKFGFTTDRVLRAGSVLFGDTEKVVAWDVDNKKVIAYYPVISASGVSGTQIDSSIFEENKKITITRPVPDLDFICERNNRLFGCSNKEKTIYASELGEPSRFYSKHKSGVGSYAVAVGSDGDFTGCTRLGSSVLFWKEDKLYKLLGEFPSEYALYDYDVDGVQQGSHKSQQVINEVLYYLGTQGVYAYTGGVPTLISENFGQKRFKNGVAGRDTDSYYLSADGEDNAANLFSYETLSGVWLREDDFRAKDFARSGNDLYVLRQDGIFKMNDGATDKKDYGDGLVDEKSIEWMAYFTPFYETMQGRKTYSKLLIRAEIPQGAYIKPEVRYDGGDWKSLPAITGGKDAKNDTVAIPIPINRCDKFELRLSGKGDVAILGMVREFMVRSDK